MFKIADFWLKVTAEIWTFENHKKCYIQTENRQTEKPITEAPLIVLSMERWVERANKCNKSNVNDLQIIQWIKRIFNQICEMTKKYHLCHYDY